MPVGQASETSGTGAMPARPWPLAPLPTSSGATLASDEAWKKFAGMLNRVCGVERKQMDEASERYTNEYVLNFNNEIRIAFKFRVGTN